VQQPENIYRTIDLVVDFMGISKNNQHKAAKSMKFCQFLAQTTIAVRQPDEFFFFRLLQSGSEIHFSDDSSDSLSSKKFRFVTNNFKIEI